MYEVTVTDNNGNTEKYQGYVRSYSTTFLPNGTVNMSIDIACLTKAISSAYFDSMIEGFDI